MIHPHDDRGPTRAPLRPWAGLLCVPLLCTLALPAQEAPKTQGEQKSDQAKVSAMPASCGITAHWTGAAALLGAAVHDRDNKSVGTIGDLIVTINTGTFDSALIKLSSEKRTVTLPCSLLQWNAKDRCYVTTATEQYVAAQPDFEAKNLPGVPDKTSNKGTADADAKRSAKKDAAAMVSEELPPVRALLSSLAGTNVLRGTEVVGRVTEVITEISPASAALLLVRPGTDLTKGLSYVVPWRALRMDAKHQLQMKLDPAKKLDTAPTLERPDAIDSPDFLRRVCSFYAVPAIYLPKQRDTGNR